MKTHPDSPYSKHPFNLTILPVHNPSVLCDLEQNISGMVAPWLYVGHLFSTFCWHVEDHWAYAVNYLHLGETKTWYIVPGSAMEQFETIMRNTAPELFGTLREKR
jgi:histone demethylase JARID1